MSSALRLGLSRPAAGGPSHLLRPFPACHTTRSALPPMTTTRAFSSTPAVLKKAYIKKSTRKSDAWVPTKPYIKRTGLPAQGVPVDQEAKGAPHIPIPNPYHAEQHIPAYPYGPRRVYKQSNYGLYGNARIRFGNNVSEKHNVKTPRVWRPNVQRKRLWSFALGCWVQTRMTMRVLRTTDKVGGLDEYLLGDKPARIKELGPWGWKLRWRILQSDVVKNRFHKQRIALGLVAKTQEEYDEEIAAEMKSVGRDSPHSPLFASIEETIAETDRMIASGADITLGDPLGIEGMTLEPEVAEGDGTSASNNVSPPENISPPGKTSPPKNGGAFNASEMAKDEGFMREEKP